MRLYLAIMRRWQAKKYEKKEQAKNNVNIINILFNLKPTFVLLMGKKKSFDEIDGHLYLFSKDIKDLLKIFKYFKEIISKLRLY
jgi:hypothetical protein